MFDSLLFPLPESLDSEDYVTATYLMQAPASADPFRKAAAIAIEQTTGTWLPVPEETPEVRKAHVGRVTAVWEVPDHEYEVPKSTETRSYVIQIAYPHVNFGSQIPMLLTTVMGNISMAGPLKLIDVSFPKKFIAGFRGPKFGVQGVREILGVTDRPFVNNMIKPCTGFPPEVGARLFFEAARGGTDMIKDDELLAEPVFSPLDRRVKLYMEAARRADEEKGEKTLYTVNITDRADKVRDNALRCIDAGANALMINYLTVGISVLQSLAEDDQINVPILAHLDFAGTMYESPISGLSSHLILGKLARLAGADMVVYPSPYGKFPFIRQKHLKIALSLTQPFYHLKPALPAPGGKMNPGVVPDVMGDLGNDCIIAAGGAVHGHPMGPAAGARALRQAIDATRQGIDLETYAHDFPELKAAIDAWGIPGRDPQAQSCDLKGM